MSEPRYEVNRFTNVDAAEKPAEMVAYLDDATRLAAEGKRASYLALGLQPGMHVLDVGCGTGDDVRALAQIVGAQGRASGIDSSRTMIDQAVARGVPGNVEFQCAPATAIPFADASYDAARAERVFQHLEDPQTAASEIYRVLKPGGTAMLIDQDWETLVVAGAEKSLTRRICNAFTDRLTNGWAGRNHAAVLKRAGFQDVQLLPTAIQLPFAPAMSLVLKIGVGYAVETGIITAGEGATWTADLQMAEERGEFVCAFTMFAALGRR